MFVPEDVALSCQGFVALPATEVAAVPVLVHRLRVFATENQLQHANIGRLEIAVTPWQIRSLRNLYDGIASMFDVSLRVNRPRKGESSGNALSSTKVANCPVLNRIIVRFSRVRSGLKSQTGRLCQGFKCIQLIK